MTEMTTDALRGLSEEALYEALRGGGEHVREAARAEIERRQMAGLPQGVAETIACVAERGRPDLAAAEPCDVVFTVTTDYDDGPAWDTGATVFMSDGQQIPVDFGRTGIADSLVELSEHARPSAGDVLIVDLGARTAEVRRG